MTDNGATMTPDQVREFLMGDNASAANQWPRPDNPATFGTANEPINTGKYKLDTIAQRRMLEGVNAAIESQCTEEPTIRPTLHRRAAMAGWAIVRPDSERGAS